QQNYAGLPNITPVNVAVHNTETSATIYRVDPARLRDAPDFAIGISSFDPDHHRRSNINPQWIIQETVRCQTLPEIAKEHGMQRIDYLQIDTEGYDAEILLGLDFSWTRPAVICFEHGGPAETMSPEQRIAVRNHLHAAGYELILMESDAVAIHHGVMDGSMSDACHNNE
ncbi:MAG: FkbM family methyltransferase, partial [Planctomycetota bacterium]